MYLELFFSHLQQEVTLFESSVKVIVAIYIVREGLE